MAKTEFAKKDGEEDQEDIKKDGEGEEEDLKKEYIKTDNGVEVSSIFHPIVFVDWLRATIILLYTDLF